MIVEYSKHQKHISYEHHIFLHVVELLQSCSHMKCTVKGHGLNVFSISTYCALDYIENMHTGLQLKGRIDYM